MNQYSDRTERERERSKGRSHQIYLRGEFNDLPRDIRVKEMNEIKPNTKYNLKQGLTDE